MSTQIIRPPSYQRPNGKLYLANQQFDLVDNTETLVLLDAIPAAFVDGIEDVANHRIVTGVSGWYSIVGQITFTNAIVDKAYIGYVYIDGVAICSTCVHSSSPYVVVATMPLPCHYINASDGIDLRAKSRSDDNTVDISHLEAGTFLSVQRVR